MDNYKGQKGTYNGSDVEVTKVHDDGALDLQKVWSGTGSAENLPWYERVPADQFTPNESAKEDAPVESESATTGYEAEIRGHERLSYGKVTDRTGGEPADE